MPIHTGPGFSSSNFLHSRYPPLSSFATISTDRRLSIVIHVIIAVAVASGIFGMMRQTTQHSAGFVLPLIQPGQGYGQFVNQNHLRF